MTGDSSATADEVQADDGTRLSGRAPAKINLYLEVLGKRSDGYHEVVNVMQTLDLADDVSVTRRARGDTDVALTVGYEAPASAVHDTMPTVDDNLIVRAARAVLNAAEHRNVGFDIHLTKRIPAGGGLGGGSSDAATTIRLVNQLLNAPLSSERTMSIAATLGADVPFFLVGGTALCTGRGDVVTPIAPPAHFDTTLIIPSWRLPTPRVYAALAARPWEGDRSDVLAWARRFDGANVGALETFFRNDLERAAVHVQPNLGEILADPSVHLSGSGSTLFTWASDCAHVMGPQQNTRESVIQTRSTDH